MRGGRTGGGICTGDDDGQEASQLHQDKGLSITFISGLLQALRAANGQLGIMMSIACAWHRQAHLSPSKPLGLCMVFGLCIVFGWLARSGFCALSVAVAGWDRGGQGCACPPCQSASSV